MIFFSPRDREGVNRREGMGEKLLYTAKNFLSLTQKLRYKGNPYPTNSILGRGDAHMADQGDVKGPKDSSLSLV